MNRQLGNDYLNSSYRANISVESNFFIVFAEISLHEFIAAAKKMRLPNASTSSPEAAVNEKQESKRKRKNLTKEQLEILEAVYARDKYPHIEERLKLEGPTKLTEDRIQVWFQNRRAKDRKKIEAEKLQQYFENNQVAECERNNADSKNALSYSPAKSCQSPERKNSNSGSDISDNENLSCGGSPTDSYG